ncbi:MAG: polysaccharide deacetylase family protein, partial [Deltaproteobacteria bacterium]|nr:polysaccharide deacetylase family protein [Deltaproteobacteria bacterium]
MGITSFLAASVLLLFQIELSIIPLGIFLATCFFAPFFPGIGYFLPIITHGKPTQKAVAITFDDGPDPLSNSKLLGLLSKHNVKATFFVSGKSAAQYPELMNAIIQAGHTVGNHTFHHDNLIMLKGRNALTKEIESAQNVLKIYGIRPFVFRPPAGITNPILGGILVKFGMHCVNFRCRAFDTGNRKIRNLAKKILHRVRPGDIILLHDIIPAGKTDNTLSDWLNEIEKILAGLKKKGLSIFPLSEII